MWFPGRVPAVERNDIKKNLGNQNKCAFNNKILCLMTICQFFLQTITKVTYYFLRLICEKLSLWEHLHCAHNNSEIQNHLKQKKLF